MTPLLLEPGMNRFFAGGALAVLLTACGHPAATPPAAPAGGLEVVAAGTAATLGDWGIETANLSQAVAPGDDFFTHVNAGWLETTEMPAGFARFGAFAALSLEVEERVEAIVEESAEAQAPAGDPRQQIGHLYASFMNTDRIEALGLAPLQDTLDELLAIQTHEQAARWMARPGTSSIASIYVGQDPGNPQRYIVHIGQSGLGLPNREYYERDDEPFPGHRDAYIDYIAATLERAGVADPPPARARHHGA
jgi:putative endopeptidase